MPSDEFMFDQMERSREHRSQQRRNSRSKRRRFVVCVVLCLLALLTLAAPSVVCHTSMGTSMISSSLQAYGFDAEAESMRVGWITPLKIEGLHISSADPDRGSRIDVQQIKTSMTVMDLISLDTQDLGEILVRGLHVRCNVSRGVCSLENDLAALMQSDSSDGDATEGVIQIQEARLEVTDTVTGRTWTLEKSNSEIQLSGSEVRGSLSGMLNQPSGGGGSLQADFQFSAAGQPNQDKSSAARTIPHGQPQSASQWKLNLSTESLPLSVADLILRRFPAITGNRETTLSGEASGALSLVGGSLIGGENGSLKASVDDFQVRNVSVAGLPGERDQWSNALATVDGQFSLVGDRVIGHGLTATTDFAGVTLDGAFSTAFSLVGSDDNPLRWLEALEGAATVDVDLAAFHRAMPGILPLRDGTKLMSGKTSATIQSLTSPASNAGSSNSMIAGVRQTQLTIKSDSLRASARGQAVTVQPIELTATVSNREGSVHADQFSCQSSFANASGSGNLQSGSADFEIDFGKLYSMLRPVVDFSDVSLGGTASGNVRWNATPDKLWNLSGAADAKNLLFAAPGGHRLKRSSVQCRVSAAGRWGGQSLAELTEGGVRILSGGVDMRAELVEPVAHPSATSEFLIRVHGNGRVENLAQTFQAWLPDSAQDAEGGFILSANASVSASEVWLTHADIDLTGPRFTVGNHWFSQPKAEIRFDGRLHLPSGSFTSESLTIVGDAASLALEGEFNPEKINLEVAWRADLQRVQRSLHPRVARAAADVQQVAFQPVASDSNDYRYLGDLKGTFTLHNVAGENGTQILEIDSETTGKNLRLAKPKFTRQQYAGGESFARPVASRLGPSDPEVIWSEPNLKVKGVTKYDWSTGVIQSDAMQIACDWFATTLSGDVDWNSQTGAVDLAGPARMKMDLVAEHLSRITGTQIDAMGVHESPLSISIHRDETDNADWSVQCRVGWESSGIAGLALGRTSIPLVINAQSVSIAPAVIPVGDGGQINFAGEVFYGDGPMWMRVQPGCTASNIQITQQMTNRWLKYLTPLAAEATQVGGIIGAEISEADVMIEDPSRSRVRGRLNIETMELSPGPLANSIVGGVDQLKALSRGGLAAPRDITGKTLVTLPPQAVDFSVENGIVSHQRLYMQIDRAQLITSGQVGMDSSVNMVAHVPLDESWIGRDLQGLAGQSISMPISGTLSRPRLDPRGVQNLVMKLGTQAVQTKLQDKIQEEVASGIEKLFGL